MEQLVPRGFVWTPDDPPRIDWIDYNGQVVVLKVEERVWRELYGYRATLRDVVLLKPGGATTHLGPCWTTTQPIVEQIYQTSGPIMWGKIGLADEREDLPLHFALKPLHGDDEFNMVREYLDKIGFLR